MKKPTDHSEVDRKVNNNSPSDQTEGANSCSSVRITNKLPDSWDDIFKNHRELSPEEFQFGIVKQWKTLTDRSEGYCKVNNNSPTDRSEVDCKVNKNSPTDRSEGDRKLNNNSPSDQIEGANSHLSEQIDTLIGSKSEISIDKTTTSVLVCLDREIMKMMDIMYQ